MFTSLFQRISRGWTFSRIVFVILGSLIVIQAVEQAHWAIMLVGLYFASMGVSGFGCAGGNCNVDR